MAYSTFQFLLYKRSLLTILLLNMALSIGLAILYGNKGKTDIDRLPGVHYPALLKDYLTRSLVYATLLAMAINLYGLQAVLSECGLSLLFLFFLTLAGTLHAYYYVLWQATSSDKGVAWFQAIWMLLNTSLVSNFCTQLRKKEKADAANNQAASNN